MTLHDIDKDPYMDAGAKKLARKQRKEPWGRVLVGLGMEPYHTESSARRVAEHAAEVEAGRNALRRDLLRLDALLKDAQDIIEAANYLLMGATGPEDGPTSWNDTRQKLQELILKKGFKLGHTVPGAGEEPSKHCVNCTSDDIVPTPPELNSRRSFKCNQCGYLQD